MKAFIFLYPIKYYFDSCLVDHLKLSKKANNNFRRINDIIEARYRKKGYEIYWLFFSREDSLEEPDLSMTSDYLRIEKKDNLIAAGISFKKHIEELKYPNPEFILKQMPNLQIFVVGGFHQWDCVNKLAGHAFRKGIPTLVDKDTTELFFERTSVLGDIPLIRENLSFEDLGFK